MRLKYLILLVLLTLSGCKISISTTGASIPPNSKTFHVRYIENKARIINASLSSDFTEALRDRIQSQTRLKMVTSDADVTFEGEITDYDTQPAAITGDNVAAKDRLTITVSITYTNNQAPEFNFTKSFSRYAEYSRTASLQAIEDDLVKEISEQLLDDIYNAAFVNW